MSSAPMYLVDLSEAGKGRLRWSGILLRFHVADNGAIYVSKNIGTTPLLVTMQLCSDWDGVGHECAVLVRDNGTWPSYRPRLKKGCWADVKSLVVSVTELDVSAPSSLARHVKTPLRTRPLSDGCSD
jgi:hypothetical protein